MTPRRPSALVVAALLVLPALALAPVAPAAAAGPVLSVTADGTALADGGRVVVDGPPTLRIGATADEPLTALSVRIDGVVVRSVRPNATATNRSWTVDPGRGSHTVTVRAETEGATAALETTVVVDTEPPRIALRRPVETAAVEPVPAVVRVDSPDARLAGALLDESGVASLHVEHEYEYEFGGEGDRYRRTHTIESPNGSFDRPLALGIGDNELSVRATDRLGRTRVHEFTVRLRDRAPPRVSFTEVERTGDGRLRVAGVATDDVQLASLRLTSGYDSGDTYLLDEAPPRPDPDRRSVRFETTLDVGPRTGQVQVLATDVAGSTTARELPDRATTPPVSVQIESAERDAAGDGVRVRAVVDGNGRDVTAVDVETRRPDGGRIALASVHRRGATDRVTVDRRLAAAPGPTVVRVVATDGAGGDHVATARLDGGAGAASPTATPSPDATATASPTPGGDGSGADPLDALPEGGLAVALAGGAVLVAGVAVAVGLR